MNIVTKFQDDVYARIISIEMYYRYAGVLEARPGALSRATEMELLEIHAKQQRISLKGEKGLYLLEPELMEEREFWEVGDNEPQSVKERLDIRTKCMKEYKINAMLEMNDKDGCYIINLEWYISKKELTEIPLQDLIDHAISNLCFSDIKPYCNYYSWDDY